MNNFKSVFICTSLLCCLMFIGCESRGNALMEVVAVDAKDLQAPVYGEHNETAEIVAQGANDFAFKLSATLVEKNGDENFVCSPYSVWLPLAALVNATDEQYKDELLTALDLTGSNESDINEAVSRMLYDLTKQGDKKYSEEYYYNPLKVVNAIFVSNQMTIEKNFAQTFQDYYRGSTINVDFESEEALSAVNKWASDSNEGLITNMINEFAPGMTTGVVVANAIYFADTWEWEFSEDNTKEDIFYSPAGEVEAFFMVREGDVQIYYEDDLVQAMPLEFTSGGSLYIILPKDGDAVGLLSSMTSEYFYEIQSESTDATGRLLLPRFELQGETIQLNDTLKALGVPLFDEKKAALTGGLVEGEKLVWLSEVKHKAFITVDEKGTTATGATMVMAEAEIADNEPTEPFEMNCNKPFVFVLCANTYDGGSQVLFTGIVNQP